MSRNLSDISILIKKFEKEFAKECFGGDDINQCPNDHCACKMAAEIKAYMYNVMGPYYYHYTIWDFNGYYRNKMVLSPNLVTEAKNTVLEYCWEGVTLDDIADHQSDRDALMLDDKSIINQRRNNLDNVVVYSYRKESSGKTFVASLIMREAIKQRINPQYNTDTYGWINYTTLCSFLKNPSYVSRINNLIISNWLVIDDIPLYSGRGRRAETFFSSLLDPFFSERSEHNLPTIFIFRFNVDAAVRWEEIFGVTVSGIIKSDRAFKIKLNN